VVLNDFYDEKTRQDRNFWLHQLTLEGPVDAGGGIAAAEVPALVEKLGTRLFRRPMLDEEKAKWQGFATLALKEGLPPIEALEYVLRGMLVSPSFLYRTEPRPVGDIQHGIALVDEFSLASRLSYFLWSAPPDDRLLQLAAKGELRKNFAAEVKRMIADWRGSSLGENFAGQWLQLRDMDIASPDSRAFPEWKGGLGYLMKKESQTFFDHILHENRSVIEFLNADYTFMNDKLARFYGIEGVKGDKYQKVSLQGTPRGGILTHGSILTLTSNPTRTSPVKRGKYLLEKSSAPRRRPRPAACLHWMKKARSSNLTLRQQFAEHRSNRLLRRLPRLP
jgi:hypothetical protein